MPNSRTLNFLWHRTAGADTRLRSGSGPSSERGSVPPQSAPACEHRPGAQRSRPGCPARGCGHRRPWGSLTRGPGALAAGPPGSRRPQAVDDVVRDAGALGHRQHEVAGDGAGVAHQEGAVALALQQRYGLDAAQPAPVPARPVLGIELPGHGGRAPPPPAAAAAARGAAQNGGPGLTSPTGRDRTRGAVTSSPRAGGVGVRAAGTGRRERPVSPGNGSGWETPLQSASPTRDPAPPS